jgi:tRNA A-37 threonylcarbamoyl transferase component Bud32
MADIICPQCKAINRDTARYCHECGAPLQGAQPKPASSFPSGEPLQAAQPKPASGPTSGEPPLDEEVRALSGGMVLENRYRIERELGRGGFGAVYRAWDVRLSKAVAVKENLETSAEAKRQFTREAQVLANLSHPNLPRVIDHFVLEEQGQYLVMDFVEGEDLLTLLQQQGSVPLRQAMEWLAQVVSALDYLHSQEPPVLHRDIKPSNIRITPRGKAMLVDFGLVKVSDPHMKTTVGARAITPGYAPPEQYGTGKTDPRTDIYALGATMYRVVTGREPPESVQRMTGEYLVPPHQVDPRISPQISHVIERAMELDPALRYQNASEFEKELRLSLSAPPGPARRQEVMGAAPGATAPHSQTPAALHSDQPRRPGEPFQTAVPDMSGDLVQPAGSARVAPAPQRAAATVVARPISGPPASGTVRAQEPTFPHPAAEGQIKRPNRTLLWVGLAALAVLCLGGMVGLGALLLGPGQFFTDTTATAQLLGSKVAAALNTSTAQAAQAAAQATAQFNTNATATADSANAQATSTAKVQVTSTAIARWTSVAETADARKRAPTQTAVALDQYVNSLLANKTLVLGPKSGSLKHNPGDGYIVEDEYTVDINNFAIEVRFYNPYATSKGEWDCGFLFKTSDDKDYRLVLASDANWEIFLRKADGGREKVFADGEVHNLNTAEGGSNQIRFVHQGERGWLYLNGSLITEVDLFGWPTRIVEMSVATELYNSSGVAGATTRYDSFSLWSLP